MIIRFSINPKNLSLEITSAPDQLLRKSIDFMPQRQPRVQYPKDTSAFLNYSVNYAASGSSGFQEFNLSKQLGVRFGELLFLSDSSFTKSGPEERFVRLMSTMTYDRRDAMQRLAVGDFIASSGDLGSSLNLGGISFSKIYGIDPYFINHPLLNQTGFVSLPSDVDVYLDGVRIRTGKLSPGGYELKNISSYAGARMLEIVIRDPFGREQRLRNPFYFTDVMLKKGLHEYSYNLGFLREGFNIESNSYGSPVFAAFHRYGISDSLNLGFRSEVLKRLFNFGSSFSYLIPNMGLISLAVSGSAGSGGPGTASSLTHTYQDGKINTSLSLRRFSENYITALGRETTKYEGGAGIGYGSMDLGSLFLDFNTIKKYQGQNRQTLAATYSKTLSRKFSVFTTIKNIRENKTANEIFIGLTYYPKTDTTVSLRHERKNDADSEIIEIQKNPPLGEGLGIRATLERTDSQSVSTYTFNPRVQYNARYGIVAAELIGRRSGGRATEEYRLSAAGGIAYVGNVIGFSRPIDDSFGLVKVGDLEGVRVYAANQEIGRTDRSGRIFVPALNSFLDNQLSISDKDIPIDYAITEVVKYISPPFRSGSYIKFDVTRVQFITGRLRLRTGGEVSPAEFGEVRMVIGGRDITFPVARGGEFYQENIPPGSYRASFHRQGKTCSFGILVPETQEMMIDVGEVICEDIQ